MAVAVVLLASPGTASAAPAVLRVVDGPAGKQIQYHAAPGVDDNVSFLNNGPTWSVNTFTDMTFDSWCTLYDRTDMGDGTTRLITLCPTTAIADGVIDLGDMNDRGGVAFSNAVSFLVNGGSGNDHISTTDDFPDTIDCGPGYDVASGDWVDTIAADCEQVTRSGGAAPTDVWKRADGRPIGVSINKERSSRTTRR
jgi:hypothetical protein